MSDLLARRLQIRHFRLIVAIADLRQLSLAAEALGITQPAASRALRELEEIVGAPAFDRGPKGMTPTPLGAGLVRHARNLLDELSEAALEVDRLRTGSGGVVRIGAVTGAAVGYVVPAIQQLKAAAPAVELHVQVATSEELVNGLVAMRYDMVLGRLPPGLSSRDLDLVPAKGERVRLIANARHRAAAAAGLSLAELTGDSWVVQGPGAPIRQALEQTLREIGAPLPGNVTNTSSLLVILALLRDPTVVAPVAEEVANLIVTTASDLCRLDIRETVAVSPYSLITLRARRLSPAAARCHELLCDVLRSRRAGPKAV